jgi:sulfite dehydrogenase
MKRRFSHAEAVLSQSRKVAKAGGRDAIAAAASAAPPAVSTLARDSVSALRAFASLREILAALFVTACIARAGSLKIELPAETATLKEAPGSQLVTAQCVVCHSVEYISTQPTLPRTYWQGAVAKMQQKFGAPIDTANVEAIVDYLVKNYGAEKAPAAR